MNQRHTHKRRTKKSNTQTAPSDDAFSTGVPFNLLISIVSCGKDFDSVLIKKQPPDFVITLTRASFAKMTKTPVVSTTTSNNNIFLFGVKKELIDTYYLNLAS